MPQKYTTNRLGSAELFQGWSAFGDFGFDPYSTLVGPSSSAVAQAEAGQISLHTPEGAKVHTAGEKVTAAHSDRGYQARQPAAPPSRGVSAGEVLTGIGAILKPLAEVGVGIYAAQQQAKLAKQQLKYGQQQSFAPAPAYFPPPPQQKSPVILIVIVLVVIMMAGGMFFMMQGGDAPAGGGYAPVASGGGVATTMAPMAAAPRITKVRRVRRGRRP